MLSCVKKETEQANIILGAPSVVNNDPRRFAYSLLDIIIGGGMSSRLFQEIREKRGLVYSVYASSQPYEGAGIFEMYAGTRPENVAEVVKVATEQFALAAQDGVSDDELARAKELAAGSFVLGTESTRTRMSRLGAWPCSICPVDSIDEMIEKYRAVTIDEVNDAARALFTQDMTLAVVSPYKQEKIERMLR